MGFFSWKTADTNESIMNTYTKAPTTCTVLWSDGERWEDVTTDGYGRFGGRCIYETIAKKNGMLTREEALTALGLVSGRAVYDFEEPFKQGMVVPKFVANKDAKFEDLPFSDNARGQGYFYADEDFEFIKPTLYKTWNETIEEDLDYE